MKCLKTAALVSGLVASLALSAAPAKASTVFEWTLSGGTTGSGTITVNDVSVTDGNSKGETITAVTGTFDGSAIVGLVNNADDNLLFPIGFGTNGFGPLKSLLDANGVFFKTASETVNIFFAGIGYDVEAPAGQTLLGGVGGNTFSVTATPLPSTWIMMISGLLGLGLLVRYKKYRSNAYAAV